MLFWLLACVANSCVAAVDGSIVGSKPTGLANKLVFANIVLDDTSLPDTSNLEKVLSKCASGGVAKLFALVVLSCSFFVRFGISEPKNEPG